MIFNKARGIERWELTVVLHSMSIFPTCRNCFRITEQYHFPRITRLFCLESCHQRNWYHDLTISILYSLVLYYIMRGRWASAAVGAGIARHRAGAAADQQVQAANQASQLEMQKMEAQHQHEMDQLRMSQAQAAPQPQAQAAEDPMAKLKKLADLKQQGILSEEEFQKMKASLLAQL